MNAFDTETPPRIPEFDQSFLLLSSSFIVNVHLEDSDNRVSVSTNESNTLQRIMIISSVFAVCSRNDDVSVSRRIH